MATATRKNTEASAPTTIGGFEILDEAPPFRTATGREAGELRNALEQLPVGKSLVTGVTVSGEVPTTKDDRNALARVRQKGTEIQKKLGKRGMFSVGVDVQNRIIVSRNEGYDAPVGDEDEDPSAD